MEENIVFWVVIFVTSVPIFGMAIFAFLKKTPVHFYAGTTVKAEEITDVKKYNRANGILWLGYGLGLILSAYFLASNEGSLGSIVFIAYIFLGLLVLLLVYRKIYDKYRMGKK